MERLSNIRLGHKLKNRNSVLSIATLIFWIKDQIAAVTNCLSGGS
jgi:hypothetical protein